MRYTRMCLRLWSFRHAAGDTIDYSVDTHPVGLELRVAIKTPNWVVFERLAD